MSIKGITSLESEEVFHGKVLVGGTLAKDMLERLRRRVVDETTANVDELVKTAPRGATSMHVCRSRAMMREAMSNVLAAMFAAEYNLALNPRHGLVSGDQIVIISA